VETELSMFWSVMTGTLSVETGAPRPAKARSFTIADF
jgi:hypothetical protein